MQCQTKHTKFNFLHQYNIIPHLETQKCLVHAFHNATEGKLDIIINKRALKFGQAGKCLVQTKLEDYLPDGQGGIQIFFELCIHLLNEINFFNKEKKQITLVFRLTSYK